MVFAWEMCNILFFLGKCAAFYVKIFSKVLSVFSQKKKEGNALV
jgi:hypothetical protein